MAGWASLAAPGMHRCACSSAPAQEVPFQALKGSRELPAGLDLDITAAFAPLDTDGNGHQTGKLQVSVELVGC